MAMAFLSFGQSLGGAIFITIGNALFGDMIRSQIPVLAPGVDADAVIAAGATAFRSVVRPSDLPGVLLAYSYGVDRVFILTTALAGLICVTVWGLGWHDVRKKPTPKSKP